MNRLTRDGTAEPVSRDQIIRHARGQGNVHFPCSADHEQDWQPYPVDPYSAICDDHTYIVTYIRTYCLFKTSFESRRYVTFRSRLAAVITLFLSTVGSSSAVLSQSNYIWADLLRVGTPGDSPTGKHHNPSFR